MKRRREEEKRESEKPGQYVMFAWRCGLKNIDDEDTIGAFYFHSCEGICTIAVEHGGRMAADGWTGRWADGWTENENEGVQHVGVGSCQNAMDDGLASRIQGRETERKMEGRRRGEKTEED